MDDLFGGMLVAAAVAALVALAIAIAVAMVAGAAAVTSVWALGAGVAAFSGQFAVSIRDRGGARRAARAPEPAFELYVLGQLFADFRHAVEHAAGVLAGVRTNLSAWASRWSDGPTMPISIGAVVGGYVGTGVAGLIGCLFGAVVGLVVGVAWVFSSLLIWVLRAADALRRRVRRAAYECPTDHERFSLPVYICPACGAEHGRLVPGRWGIFKRECQCGKTALPTTVITGRQRVPQQCPLGHSMSGFLGFAENLPIAIVGGPSSGKSTFLAGSLLELDAPNAGVSLEPLSESRDAYSRLIDAMRAGKPPEKTTDERLPALVAEVQGSGRSRALYAYDVAGEVYGAEDKVRGLRFLARSAGIAMLVDPFAIPRVANDRAEELAGHVDQILPSSEDPMRVYERLVATLTEAGVDTQKMPLAVIVAKADACGISDEIDKLVEDVGTDRAPRAWLEANGAGNLVRAVEQQFKQVGWFSVSALGRMPDPSDSSPFVPRGALAPFLWILARRDVHPSSEGAKATNTAQRLVGTAADFPPPSSTARSWRATAGALAATALIAVPAAVAATQIHISGGGTGAAYAANGGSGSAGGSGGSASSGGSSGSSGSSNSGATTYPLQGSGSQVVRTGPSVRANVIGQVDASAQVTIVCTSQGDPIAGNTLWDRIAQPSGFVSDTVVSTGTNGPVAPACTGADKGTVPPPVPAPVRALRLHYQRLGSGDYQGAFSLFSPAYQSQNPSWPNDRQTADPMINVIKTGSAHYSGGSSATVYILFYAQDRNPSPGSDTICRRFEGSAHLILTGQGWRFDPQSGQYTATTTPGDPNCHP